MANITVLRFIDGGEYYVDNYGNVIGKLDAYTGKKETYEADGSWIITEIWFNKLLGKGSMSLQSFINEFTLGKIRFTDNKGISKYGVVEAKNGGVKRLEPLKDYGISFIKSIDSI